MAPSFHGNRIVSSDTFKIMVQAPENAPFNDGHSGWIDPGTAGARFWAAEVRPDGKAVALEFSSPSTGFGVVLASADGALGGETALKCFLPAAGEAQDVSWSPDGTMLAWADDEGVKVARAPDLAAPPAAEDKCVMGSAPTVLSATGEDPNFGGADVPAMIAARGGDGGGGAPQPGPGSGPGTRSASGRRGGRGARAGEGLAQARLQGDGHGAGGGIRGREAAARAQGGRLRARDGRGRRPGQGQGQAAARSARPDAAWEGPHAAGRVVGREWGLADRYGDGARALSPRLTASRSARSVDQNASALQGRSAGS